ncbi:MAG: ATPase [Gammaproteobacteria bacterium]|nr:ATPase [Gammaproteobacteria bacterium]
MKFELEEFRAWENKRVTLVGMSGVGKSYLSAKLRGNNWFHYSGDYRIGTRYLNEHIIDMIKAQAIRIPFLKELLRNDWIYIKNNIRVNDLGPVLSFVGKLGNPELGGVEIDEFVNRQAIYRQAEVDAMYDIPHFIKKAQDIYGYPHFVNDVGGSLCELGEPEVMDILVENTLILYIQVTNTEQEQVLIERAVSDPKPLYYRADFLQQHLQMYFDETGLEYAAQIDPDDFARWVFPHLFHSRLPRYDAIANFGYTVTSEEVERVQDDADFVDLLERAIERQSGDDS